MRVRENTEWVGRAGCRCRKRKREEPIKEGVGRDDFKAEYVGAHDATSYVNEIVSIVFSRRGILSLSIFRGLIEKQRLQFLQNSHFCHRC